MTLTVNTVGDAPQQPGITAEAYIPDQLIAGNLKLVTETASIASGTLQRGTVLGQITGTAAVGTVTFAGTGNGVLTKASPAFSSAAQVGSYQAICLEKTTDSGAFEIIRPDGTVDGVAIVGTAYTGQVKFTIADGSTDFAQGDTFTLPVTIAAAGGYVKAVATATDGSQVPTAILADDADASSTAVNAPVYLMGEFNGSALILDASFTVASVTPLLRKRSIFVKSSVSAADPT